MKRTKKILILASTVILAALLNGCAAEKASAAETKTAAAFTATPADTATPQATATATPIPEISISGKVFHDIDHNFVEGMAYGIEVPYSGDLFSMDESKLPLSDIRLCAFYFSDDGTIEACSEIGPEGSYQITLPLLNEVERLAMKMKTNDYLNWTVVTDLEYTESDAAYERTIVLPDADVHRNDAMFYINTNCGTNLTADFALTKTDLTIPIPSQYLHHVHEIGLFDREPTDKKITQIYSGETFTPGNYTLYQNSVFPDIRNCLANHPAIDFFVDDDEDPTVFTNESHIPVINPYIDEPIFGIRRYGPEYGNFIDISTSLNNIVVAICHHDHFSQEEGIFEVNEKEGIDDQTGITYGSVVGIIDDVASGPPYPHPHMAVIKKEVDSQDNFREVYHDPIKESVPFEEKVEQINNETYSDYEYISNMSIPELTLEGYSMQDGRLVIFAPTFEMRDADGNLIEIPAELYQEIIE